MLEVRRVVDAGSQHHHGRPAGGARDGASRREPDEVVEELPRIESTERTPSSANQSGKVRVMICRFARTYETPLGVRRLSSSTIQRPSSPDQVAPRDMDVLVVGNVDADDLTAKMAAQDDERGTIPSFRISCPW